MLGQFQRLISDIAPQKLHDTLVGFHITPAYLQKLDEALAKVGCSGYVDGSTCTGAGTDNTPAPPYTWTWRTNLSAPPVLAIQRLA